MAEDGHKNADSDIYQAVGVGVDAHGASIFARLRLLESKLAALSPTATDEGTGNEPEGPGAGIPVSSEPEPADLQPMDGSGHGVVGAGIGGKPVFGQSSESRLAAKNPMLNPRQNLAVIRARAAGAARAAQGDDTAPQLPVDPAHPLPQPSVESPPKAENATRQARHAQYPAGSRTDAGSGSRLADDEAGAASAPIHADSDTFHSQPTDDDEQPVRHREASGSVDPSPPGTPEREPSPPFERVSQDQSPASHDAEQDLADAAILEHERGAVTSSVPRGGQQGDVRALPNRAPNPPSLPQVALVTASGRRSPHPGRSPPQSHSGGSQPESTVDVPAGFSGSKSADVLTGLLRMLQAASATGFDLEAAAKSAGVPSNLVASITSDQSRLDEQQQQQRPHSFGALATDASASEAGDEEGGYAAEGYDNGAAEGAGLVTPGAMPRPIVNAAHTTLSLPPPPGAMPVSSRAMVAPAETPSAGLVPGASLVLAQAPPSRRATDTTAVGRTGDNALAHDSYTSGHHSARVPPTPRGSGGGADTMRVVQRARRQTMPSPHAHPARHSHNHEWRGAAPARSPRLSLSPSAGAGSPEHGLLGPGISDTTSMWAGGLRQPSPSASAASAAARRLKGAGLAAGIVTDLASSTATGASHAGWRARHRRATGSPLEAASRAAVDSSASPSPGAAHRHSLATSRASLSLSPTDRKPIPRGLSPGIAAILATPADTLLRARSSAHPASPHAAHAKSPPPPGARQSPSRQGFPGPAPHGGTGPASPDAASTPAARRTPPPAFHPQSVLAAGDGPRPTPAEAEYESPPAPPLPLPPPANAQAAGGGGDSGAGSMAEFVCPPLSVLHAREEEEAAVRIQTCVRGLLARLEAQRRCNAALLIADAVTILVSERNERRRLAAVAIQAVARGRLSRRRQRERAERERIAREHARLAAQVGETVRRIEEEVGSARVIAGLRDAGALQNGKLRVRIRVVDGTPHVLHSHEGAALAQPLSDFLREVAGVPLTQRRARLAGGCDAAAGASGEQPAVPEARAGGESCSPHPAGTGSGGDAGIEHEAQAFEQESPVRRLADGTAAVDFAAISVVSATSGLPSAGAIPGGAGAQGDGNPAPRVSTKTPPAPEAELRAAWEAATKALGRDAVSLAVFSDVGRFPTGLASDQAAAMDALAKAKPLAPRAPDREADWASQAGSASSAAPASSRGTSAAVAGEGPGTGMGEGPGAAAQLRSLAAAALKAAAQMGMDVRGAAGAGGGAAGVDGDMDEGAMDGAELHGGRSVSAARHAAGWLAREAYRERRSPREGFSAGGKPATALADEVRVSPSRARQVLREEGLLDGSVAAARLSLADLEVSKERGPSSALQSGEVEEEVEEEDDEEETDRGGETDASEVRQPVVSTLRLPVPGAGGGGGAGLGSQALGRGGGSAFRALSAAAAAGSSALHGRGAFPREEDRPRWHGPGPSSGGNGEGGGEAGEGWRADGAAGRGEAGAWADEHEGQTGGETAQSWLRGGPGFGRGSGSLHGDEDGDRLFDEAEAEAEARALAGAGRDPHAPAHGHRRTVKAPLRARGVSPAGWELAGRRAGRGGEGGQLRGWSDYEGASGATMTPGRPRARKLGRRGSGTSRGYAADVTSAPTTVPPAAIASLPGSSMVAGVDLTPAGVRLRKHLLRRMGTASASVASVDFSAQAAGGGGGASAAASRAGSSQRAVSTRSRAREAIDSAKANRRSRQAREAKDAHFRMLRMGEKDEARRAAEEGRRAERDAARMAAQKRPDPHAPRASRGSARSGRARPWRAAPQSARRASDDPHRAGSAVSWQQDAGGRGPAASTAHRSARSLSAHRGHHARATSVGSASSARRRPTRRPSASAAIPERGRASVTLPGAARVATGVPAAQLARQRVMQRFAGQQPQPQWHPAHPQPAAHVEAWTGDAPRPRSRPPPRAHPPVEASPPSAKAAQPAWMAMMLGGGSSAPSSSLEQLAAEPGGTARREEGDDDDGLQDRASLLPMPFPGASGSARDTQARGDAAAARAGGWAVRGLRVTEEDLGREEEVRCTADTILESLMERHGTARRGSASATQGTPPWEAAAAELSRLRAAIAYSATVDKREAGARRGSSGLRAAGEQRATQLAALELILHGYRGGTRSPPESSPAVGAGGLSDDATSSVVGRGGTLQARLDAAASRSAAGASAPAEEEDDLPVSRDALASAMSELQEDTANRDGANPVAFGRGQSGTGAGDAFAAVSSASEAPAWARKPTRRSQRAAGAAAPGSLSAFAGLLPSGGITSKLL